MNSSKKLAYKPPHAPFRVSELCSVTSLDNWSNTQVKVLGRLKVLPNDYTFTHIEKECNDVLEEDLELDTCPGIQVKNIYQNLMSGERKNIFDSSVHNPCDESVQELDISGNWDNASFYNCEDTVDLMAHAEETVTEDLSKYREAVFKGAIYKFAHLHSVGEQGSTTKIKVDIRCLDLQEALMPECHNKLVFLFGTLEVVDCKPLLYCQFLQDANNLSLKLYNQSLEYLRAKFPRSSI